MNPSIKPLDCRFTSPWIPEDQDAWKDINNLTDSFQAAEVRLREFSNRAMLSLLCGLMIIAIHVLAIRRLFMARNTNFTTSHSLNSPQLPDHAISGDIYSEKNKIDKEISKVSGNFHHEKTLPPHGGFTPCSSPLTDHDGYEIYSTVQGIVTIREEEVTDIGKLLEASRHARSQMGSHISDLQRQIADIKNCNERFADDIRQKDVEIRELKHLKSLMPSATWTHFEDPNSS